MGKALRATLLRFILAGTIYGTYLRLTECLCARPSNGVFSAKIDFSPLFFAKTCLSKKLVLVQLEGKGWGIYGNSLKSRNHVM